MPPARLAFLLVSVMLAAALTLWVAFLVFPMIGPGGSAAGIGIGMAVAMTAAVLIRRL